MRKTWLVALLGVWPLAAFACSTQAAAGGEGAECFEATDCADGLACVPATGGNGKRVCSTDLSGVQMSIDAAPPVDAGMMKDGAADGEDMDGGATDGTMAMQDAPPPPVDAAPPPVDAPPPPVDAPPPPVDSGATD